MELSGHSREGMTSIRLFRESLYRLQAKRKLKGPLEWLAELKIRIILLPILLILGKYPFFSHEVHIRAFLSSDFL